MAHRFFIETPLTGKKDITIANPDIVHQVMRVLRANIADPIVLFDNSGYEYEGVLLDIKKTHIEVGGLKKIKNERELSREVYLYQCMLKKDHMELVAEKATELGITALVPVLSSRVIKTGLHVERIQKIMKEATEQSMRGRIPVVQTPVSFKEAIREATQYGESILFYENADTRLEKLITQEGRISVVIGPEGGFSPEEVEYATKKGCTIASLGLTRLRSETAAIVGVARIADLLF